MPRRGFRKDWGFLAPSDPEGMPSLRLLWLESLKTRGYAEVYLANCESDIGAFIVGRRSAASRKRAR